MTTRRFNFVSLCLLESSSCESHSLVSVLYFFACVRVSLKLVLSHENEIKRVFVFFVKLLDRAILFMHSVLLYFL